MMVYPKIRPTSRSQTVTQSSKPSSPVGTSESHLIISEKKNENPSHSVVPTTRTKSPPPPHKDDIFLKSRVDQSLYIMKKVYMKAGEEIRPDGHSQFDALGQLKSDVCFSVLNKKRWSDFFEEIKAERDGTNDLITDQHKKIEQDSYYPAVSFAIDPHDHNHPHHRMNAQDTFKSMRKRIVNLWHELKIPQSDTDFYSYTMLRECKGSMEQFSDMSKYISVLLNYRSSTMAVIQEIHMREYALEIFFEFISKLKQSMNVNEYRDSLLDIIQKIQICSVNVIHQIQNWRSNFWRPMPFHFRYQNYLSKMQYDLEIIKADAGKYITACQLVSDDLLCVFFSIDGLEIEEGITRRLNNLPLEVLRMASEQVYNESSILAEISKERTKLQIDGLFIPMLRFERIGTENGARISGGIIPEHYPHSQFEIMNSQGSSKLDNGDDCSRATRLSHIISLSSSRADV